MTELEPTIPAGVAAPDRVGQATAVEQSRAIAEVQGAIVVAQRCPRNVPGAIAEMRESCRQEGLAKRAFFKFPRGNTSVQGASVYLARELARCWGNVQYGVSELRRDDVHGQSEMQAYAWDVQTNSRVVTTFVVPHMRDKKGGPEKLTDMRDIYENNANAGARRVRECVFSILPPWFVEEAKSLCMRTIQEGGGVPRQKRIANIVGHYANVGITEDQLVRKIGRGTAQWMDLDIAQLEITLGSIRNGEIQKDEEFPPERVKAADIVDPAPAAPVAASVPEQAPAPTVPPAEAEAEPVEQSEQAPPVPAPEKEGTKPTPKQLTAIATALGTHGVVDREQRLAVISFLVGDRIASSKDMSRDEAGHVIDSIERLAGDGSFAETIKSAYAAAGVVVPS